MLQLQAITGKKKEGVAPEHFPSAPCFAQGCRQFLCTAFHPGEAETAFASCVRSTSPAKDARLEIPQTTPKKKMQCRHGH